MPEKVKRRGKPRAAEASAENEFTGGVPGRNGAISASAGPTDYSVEIGEEICDRVMLGEPLRQIALLPGMPEEARIYRWLLERAEFRTRFDEAKTIEAEKLAEEILEIADDGRNDWVRRESSRGGKVVVALETEAIQRAKLRVEVRQWLISRWKPKPVAGVPAPEDPGNGTGEVRVLTEERRAVLIAKKREAVLRRMADRWGDEGNGETFNT